MAVVGLTGCGRDRFDPYAQEVAGARDARVTAVATTVARIFDGLPGYGSGRYDSCEAGQNNSKVHDGYRTRCGFTYRAVAGMAATTTPAAITEARELLSDAGCTDGAGSTDPNRIGFAGQTSRSAPLWGGLFTCAGLDIGMFVGRSADARLAAQLGSKLPGPAGITVTQNDLDGAMALADASRDGHQYVLIVDTSDDYYIDPLEDDG